MASAQSVSSKLIPRSLSSAFGVSILVHALIVASVLLYFGLRGNVVAPADDYLDLGYETFDEPPVQAPKQRPVVDEGPKEIQDEKSDIVGTQKESKPIADDSSATGKMVAAPYYKIKPKYPKAALIAGTEGWILMTIDINETGEVENIRVVDGEQRNMFQTEAKRAVEKWKYKPFLDGSGKPLRKIDHQVRVDFKLIDANPGSD